MFADPCYVLALEQLVLHDHEETFMRHSVASDPRLSELFTHEHPT